MFGDKDTYLSIAAFTYAAALDHYTIRPIRDIRQARNNGVATKDIVPMLYDFKVGKESEIAHVRNAATLSAAAVLGGFSWVRFPETHWLGQLFWSCSLWLSIGALISSVSQRLLEQLPATRNVVWEDDRLEDVLSRLMFIGKTVSTSAGTTTQNQTPPSTLPISNTTTRTTTEYFNHPTMIWVWQCPTMLMSFSWLFFILGLWLHLLSPVINGHESLVRRNTAIAGSAFGLVVMLNYFFISYRSKAAVKLAHVKGS